MFLFGMLQLCLTLEQTWMENSYFKKISILASVTHLEVGLAQTGSSCSIFCVSQTKDYPKKAGLDF